MTGKARACGRGLHCQKAVAANSTASTFRKYFGRDAIQRLSSGWDTAGEHETVQMRVVRE